jgi:hypothetical protein
MWHVRAVLHFAESLARLSALSTSLPTAKPSVVVQTVHSFCFYKMSDQEDLMNALAAHGRSFLESFGLSASSSKKRVDDAVPDATRSNKRITDNQLSDYEWTGFGNDVSDDDESDGRMENEGDGDGSEDMDMGVCLCFVQLL